MAWTSHAGQNSEAQKAASQRTQYASHCIWPRHTQDGAIHPGPARSPTPPFNLCLQHGQSYHLMEAPARRGPFRLGMQHQWISLGRVYNPHGRMLTCPCSLGATHHSWPPGWCILLLSQPVEAPSPQIFSVLIKLSTTDESHRLVSNLDYHRFFVKHLYW